ncbi:MAG: MBL fold metallo-hydrolase [Actinomycetota bacterium]|jgi:L-ascorbate metabolism protein UlaG (beta-lactamase superfamily)|nr:MBL fold metallo-hydrolase [Actinomycetota bacterium]
MDLPPLDAVVLFHLHGDHFDRVARRDFLRSFPLVTTPHAARRLQRWGFSTDALDTGLR